jgi:hypothetical protein
MPALLECVGDAHGRIIAALTLNLLVVHAKSTMFEQEVGPSRNVYRTLGWKCGDSGRTRIDLRSSGGGGGPRTRWSPFGAYPPTPMRDCINARSAWASLSVAPNREVESVSTRGVARGVWGLWGLVAVSFATASHLHNLNGSAGVSVLEQAALILGFGSFASVGALIASRRPKNAIGWIFLAIGVSISLGVLSDEYSTYAFVTDPGPLPGRVLAAWISTWYWYPSLMLFTFFPLLLFPDGHPPSRRWRPLLWFGIAGTGCITLLAALRDEIGSGFLIDNPIGVYSTSDLESEKLFVVLTALVLVSLPLVVASVIVRFRRAKGDERQQLKWFVFAAGVLVAAAIAGDLVPAGLFGDLTFAAFLLGLIALPVAVAVAIFKYRLYEIDRIINKTLVYGSLTVGLAGIYVVGVLAVQYLLPVAKDSSAIVAASTLAVVAMFRPLRTHIQGFVDRRFYRARYDAVHTVEDFSVRLRQQTDLEAVIADLLGVVTQTLQPTSASLWLLQSPARR